MLCDRLHAWWLTQSRLTTLQTSLIARRWVEWQVRALFNSSKIIIRYKRIGYNMNVMRQTACLVVNTITVNNFTDIFNCPPVGRVSDFMMAPAEGFQLSWLGPDDLSLVGPTRVQLLDFCCSSISKLVCCWVLVLFHLSDESWFICSLFWFIDE